MRACSSVLSASTCASAVFLLDTSAERSLMRRAREALVACEKERAYAFGSGKHVN